MTRKEESVKVQTTASGGEVVFLSADEVRDLIDAEARGRMGISGQEFLERRRAGTLPHTPAASDISVVAALIESNGRRLR